MNILRATSRFLFALLAMTSACGGGSAGTGTKSLDGRLLSESGEGIPNIIVSLADDESVKTRTNVQGAFSLEVPVTDAVTLQITSSNGSFLTSAGISSDESAGTGVDIYVNATTMPVRTESFEITAKIEGACDIYFENNRIIRQANEVPPGTLCPLRVRATRNGEPLGGVAFTLESRSCRKGRDEQIKYGAWTFMSSGLTSENELLGLGEILFPFVDSTDQCKYRVRTELPSTTRSMNTSDEGEVVHLVHTFTAQSLGF